MPRNWARPRRLSVQSIRPKPSEVARDEAQVDGNADNEGDGDSQVADEDRSIALELANVPDGFESGDDSEGESATGSDAKAELKLAVKVSPRGPDRVPPSEAVTDPNVDVGDHNPDAVTLPLSSDDDMLPLLPHPGRNEAGGDSEDGALGGVLGSLRRQHRRIVEDRSGRKVNIEDYKE